MRQVVFRGFDLETQEWREGSLGLSDSRSRAWISNQNPKAGDIGYFSYEVDPKSVGQYIDITCSLGDRICEGDILFFDANPGLEYHCPVGSGEIVLYRCWNWRRGDRLSRARYEDQFYQYEAKIQIQG